MDDFFTSEEKKELFSLYRHLLQSAGDSDRCRGNRYERFVPDRYHVARNREGACIVYRRGERRIWG